MLLNVGQSRAAPPAGFLYALLRQCLDIRAIWSVGHTPSVGEPGSRRTPTTELLAFADRPTLARLRHCDHLHRADVQLLVVVDGDVFENAWGALVVSGSLARWAWREVSAGHAFYDEARWASATGERGAVIRERREAHLIWRLAEQPVAV